MRQGMLLFVCCLFFVLPGCVTAPYGLYEDERSMGTIIDDQSVIADVKSKLMQRNFSEGFSVSVYSFGGKVFLVGTAPELFRMQAVDIAKRCRGVQSVTAHWFSGPSSTLGDLDLKVKLNANLITTKRVSSTQVELEVHGNQVVVLGMVGSQADADRVLDVIRQTPGVLNVTSFLIVK